MLQELKGKVALVTGGGRGIGRETCILLASLGADVAICSRSASECEEVSNFIQKTYGTKTVVITGDVSKEKDVDNIIDFINKTLGSISILINNAGAMSLKPFIDTSIEEWDWIHDVNVKGPFLLCKKVIPDMMVQSEGVIINISSIWGTKGGPNRSAYISSKHAVIGLSKALGEELKPYGIRVNAICPGPVDTKMTDDLGDNINKEGWLAPIDLANIIVDFCLPKMKAVTASSIEAFGAGQPISTN
ncbi:SDR family oxidoreductase [Psychrobacillus sp. FJAT-51614]|uniref:SDR family oxidoreductase n=1 Tax=Psychrobacillus mangrovi TaxID=3117745 RepID=A0ABU8F9X7_9BACI